MAQSQLPGAANPGDAGGDGRNWRQRLGRCAVAGGLGLVVAATCAVWPVLLAPMGLGLTAAGLAFTWLGRSGG